MSTDELIKEIQGLPVKERIYVFEKTKLSLRKHRSKNEMSKVHYSEELEHDTYPFKPNIIKYENTIYDLKENLDCSVEYSDDNYIIFNEKLDINVWGETRNEAEQAFAFTFASLYLNYAKEDDANLSVQAITLKNLLLDLVKKEYSNETKKK